MVVEQLLQIVLHMVVDLVDQAVVVEVIDHLMQEEQEARVKEIMAGQELLVVLIVLVEAVGLGVLVQVDLQL